MATGTYDSLPQHLKQYATKQVYEKYTPQDQASWRYIMRQSRAFFLDHAVPVYLEGLKKTGIPLDRIPKIQEMDLALNEFGWGAIPVCGFIPPAVFLEFQARKVLPIATDMRTASHIAYTPAPDIVHEAAGHAPIIADPEYAEYLCQYATLAQKAIMSQDDIQLYEAIRKLSDVKENPDCSPEQIQEAEANLKKATESVTQVTEAAQVARMNWWTVEYGLVGKADKPQIYGAGLLSSIGESQNCLSKKVKKIPLSVDCIEYSYDITEPQPQLFVAQDMQHLTVVLRELEKRMAYSKGGTLGVERAWRAGTVCTVQLDSGIQASGVLSQFETNGSEVDFIKFEGPVQLCHNDNQLPGHGKDRHGHGFSSPVGIWNKAPNTPLQHLSNSELEGLGLKLNTPSCLQFKNGFEVRGKVTHFFREEGKLLLITWSDCKVTRGDTIYFMPEWGEFDLWIGTKVQSVFGGPADRPAYGDYAIGEAASSPGRTSPHTDREKELFALYAKIRSLRESEASEGLETDIQHLASAAQQNFKNDWLLKTEILELAHQKSLQSVSIKSLLRDLEHDLVHNTQYDSTTRWLAQMGYSLIHTRD